MGLWKYVLVGFGGIILAGGLTFFVMNRKINKIEVRYQQELTALEGKLNALGPLVTCYSVDESYYNSSGMDIAGRTIEESSITEVSVPSSLVGDNHITNKQDIVGKYFKINLEPGTPITSDVIMAEMYDDTLRDLDISVTTWVVGMREGDYVDINLTLPYGEDYLVLPHKRIQSIGNRTVKMYLTEDEWNTYQSAMVDYYLYSQKGARIYFKKYVEPGLQPSAQAFYAVSDRVKEVIRTNPNIVNMAMIEAQSVLRPVIDQYLGEVRSPQTTIEQEMSNISGGRQSYSSDVQSDYNTRMQQDQQASQDGLSTEVSDETVISFESVPETEATTVETPSPAETPAPEETPAPAEAEPEEEGGAVG